MVTGTEPTRFCIDPVIQATALVDVDLPARAEAAATARRLVERALTSWGFPETIIGNAQLVVSELVANAVQHTGSPRLRLLCWRSDNLVRIGVHDFSRELPVRVVTGSPEDQRGRGVRLVAAFSYRWGVDPAIVGKLVWAELRTRRTPVSASTSPSGASRCSP